MTRDARPAFSLRRRVQFHETDMAGVMYFANYFRLMEEIEQAFFRSLGFSVSMPDEHGRMGFPRVSVACEYFAPARFDDELELRLRLTHLGTKSLGYEVEFMHQGRRLALGRLTGVCCRASGTAFESIPIPPEMRARFEAHLSPT